MDRTGRDMREFIGGKREDRERRARRGGGGRREKGNPDRPAARPACSVISLTAPNRPRLQRSAPRSHNRSSSSSPPRREHSPGPHTAPRHLACPQWSGHNRSARTLVLIVADHARGVCAPPHPGSPGPLPARPRNADPRSEQLEPVDSPISSLTLRARLPRVDDARLFD